MNHKSSFLTKSESNAIKGLLILLVIFGHCSTIFVQLELTKMIVTYQWLYTFHVYCFLILPFLYGSKDLGKQKIFNQIARIYVPYSWLFIGCTVILYLHSAQFNGWKILLAFLIGNEPLIKKAIGFNFPWFLPSIFATIILRDFFYSSKKTVRTILLTISTILWIAIISGSTTRFIIGNYVPFAISQGFLWLILGVIARNFLRRYDNSKISILIYLCIFCIVSYTYFQFNETFPIQIKRLFYFVMPILALGTIFSLKTILSHSKFLIQIGQYSLQLYIVHALIHNGLLVLISILHINKSILSGTIILVITFILSYMFALISTKITFLRTIFYPKNFFRWRKTDIVKHN